MTRVVFMGTPDFAVPALRQLITQAEVVGVVTQPDRPAGRGRQLRPSPIKEVAIAADIPVYQPERLRSDEAVAPLREWAPDIIVVAAFGQILRANVLDLPPAGCLNIHASLLPRWRGASPIQHAILMGDAESGISLMKMDVGLDTGPVYVSQALELAPDETAQTLHDRLAELGGNLLADHLDAIVSGELVPQLQDDTLATYAPRIDKAAGLIEWQRSAVEIDRQIRAMTPWPGAFTHWEGDSLRVLAARPVEVDGRGPAGSVWQLDDQLLVQTGAGSLQLLDLQLAGKKATAAADFLRGRPHFLDAQL